MRTTLLMAAALAAFATPSAAHEFVDYFTYGRAELSPAGYGMARSVAYYAGRFGRPTRILIVGHMDTAEAAEFSDELSRRRAQAVATELVLLGLDPEVIVLYGRGASTLARPTPPDTPEQLNRRAVVNF